MKTTFSTAIATILLFFAAIKLHSQPAKVDEALEGFKKTTFMVQFLDLRTQLETTARNFKELKEQSEAGRYPAQEVRQVIAGYEQSATRANAILQSVVSDMLEPKKMKFIASYPDTYAKGLELDLRNLSDYCTQNFLQPLADLTADEADGLPILLIIAQAITLTSELSRYLQEMQQRRRKYTEEYLSQNLYEPCRFRYWDELGNWQDADPNRRNKIDLPEAPQLPPLDTRFGSNWEVPEGGR